MPVDITVTPRIYKPVECNDAASQLDIKTKKLYKNEVLYKRKRK
jgi:hypothetical protein